MKACGLIVEYNPYHNGHAYHVQMARKLTNADCIIAVMSGSFLQRGEPAIIDKIHRTKAAIASGVDLVIELPYAYAVQSSDYFAKGAILSLAQLQIDVLCFGSESGNIEDFFNYYNQIKTNETDFNPLIQRFLKQGLSYPAAYEKACHTLDIQHLQQLPNNILGNSYVRFIRDNELPMEITTIQRIQNHYHDHIITNRIASATSIRHTLLEDGLSNEVKHTLPEHSLTQLKAYYTKTEKWHEWEQYFPLLRYKILTSSTDDLANIHGMEEGIEHRLKQKIKQSVSFSELIHHLKTKRYTTTRLQRILTHLLTNTTKAEITNYINNNQIPYLRILGFNQHGKDYLQHIKKAIEVPVHSRLTRDNAADLHLDERASLAYYACLPATTGEKLRKAEFQLPIQVK